MTDEKCARVLTFNSLEAIKTALSDSDTPADFLAAADQVMGEPGSTLEWAVDLGEPDPLDVEGSDKGRDSLNAQSVFEYVGAMDRANAADGRLWTYLAFKTYRPYMEKRWPLDVDEWKNRVLTRWLLPSSVTRGRLIRHGIARLWWVAELTVDIHCDYELSKRASDPYAYTTAVFKKEDRILALFDREVGGQPLLVRTVLEHTESEPRYASDQHVRKLLKELTLVYGYREIASLPKEDLRALVEHAAL